MSRNIKWGRFIFGCLLLIGIGTVIIMLGIHMNQPTMTTTVTNDNTHNEEIINTMKSSFSLLSEQIDKQQQNLLNGQTNIVSVISQKQSDNSPPKDIQEEEEEEKEEDALECDVAIIGGGIGGLVSAYHLSPIFTARLCLFDNRQRLGGKIDQIQLNVNDNLEPIYATNADQFRGGDVLMRCLSQELNLPIITHGSTGHFMDYHYRHFNVTNDECGSNEKICKKGFPQEGFCAPNGFRNFSLYGSSLPNFCGKEKWTECSYLEKYIENLTSSQSISRIIRGQSFEEYSLSLLGGEATLYLRDLLGLESLWKFDAHWVTEYLREIREYPNGATRIPHGSIVEKLVAHIEKFHSKIYLSSFVSSLGRTLNNTELQKGHRYILRINQSHRVYTKRIIIAFPVKQLSRLGGDLVNDIRLQTISQSIDSVSGCSWNAFFPSPIWWRNYTSHCNQGYCRGNTEKSMAWSYISNSPTNGLRHVQYIPTPERVKGNLLKFYWEDYDCLKLEKIREKSGEEGIRKEVLGRMRNIWTNEEIPEPIESKFSFEEFSFTTIKKGFPYNSQVIEEWAKEPLRGESLCITTESVNPLYSGWMEGAALSSHHCLHGPVFSDLTSTPLSTSLGKLESCSPLSSQTRILSRKNRNSGNDVCLLLNNEYHMRDLAKLNYCNGPSEYNYPTKYQDKVNSSLWSKLSSIPVYEKTQLYGRRYI